MPNQHKSKELITSLIESDRRQIGMAPVTRTAERVDGIFKASGIDYSIIGGYAVQHYGYVRFTHDLDMVVRERDQVCEFLLASGEFKPVPGSRTTVVDCENGVHLDLLPANRVDGPGDEPYPEPSGSADAGLKFATLPQLIALKLATHLAKDTADAVELIKSNGLSAEFIKELPARLSVNYLEAYAQAEEETGRPIID